jgi:hypothetical protein
MWYRTRQWLGAPDELLADPLLGLGAIPRRYGGVPLREVWNAQDLAMSDSYRRASDALLKAIGEFVKTGKSFDKEWHEAAQEAWRDFMDKERAKNRQRQDVAMSELRGPKERVADVLRWKRLWQEWYNMCYGWKVPSR